MTRNRAQNENFFDPASLALEDEVSELEASSVAEVVDLGFTLENPEESGPHRIQHEFQDPLAELGLESTALQAEQAQELQVEELQAEGFQTAPDLENLAEVQTTAKLQAAAEPLLEINESETRLLMSRKLFELVLAPHSFVDLTQKALTVICEALPCEFAGLLELDANRQEFFFRASCDRDLNPLAPAQALRVPLAGTFAGEVLRTGKPEFVNGLHRDARFQHAAGLLDGAAVQSAIAAPILIGGKAFGVIEAFQKKSGEPFVNIDLYALDWGAAMLAKVLEVRFFAALVGRNG